MEFLVNLIIGAAGAVAFIAVTRAFGRLERALFAGVLLLAAVAYVGYGVAVRSASGLTVELVGSALFGALGVLGVVSSIWFLAAGWAVHAAWDFVVPAFADVSYMPSWYAASCVGFDVVVAAYLAARARGGLAISEAGAGAHAA